MRSPPRPGRPSPRPANPPSWRRSAIGSIALFRLDAADGAAAQQIAHWLHELLAQGQVESLEFLGDRPGRVPWNLLLERSEWDAGVGWDAFWGTGTTWRPGGAPTRCAAARRWWSRRHCWRRMRRSSATWPAPRSRLEAWQGERLIVDVADQLANQLHRRTPDVLIVAARIEGDALRLGADRVTPAQLQTWIAEADEGNPNPIIFLAAARSSDRAVNWESWLTAASASLDGLVTTIVPLAEEDAITAALAAAERFVQNRRPLGAAAADVRAASGPSARR